MFKFSRDQRVFDIDGVKIGGQPGELPTVMVGSIFYHGHKIVKDEAKGLFDRKRAEEQLMGEEEASLRTGNPRVIDVVGAYPEALINYIDFIADTTKSPFLMDGVTAEVRIAAARHVAEVGLVDRAIYNTIGVDVKPEELEAIREGGIESAVLLAFNPRKPTVGGRLEVLEGSQGGRGLIEVASEAGVEKPLVDVSVLDVPDVGPAAKAVYLVKERHGLPSGCAPANAIDMWRRNRSMDADTFLVNNATAHSAPAVVGADFIMYGPLSRASDVYPAVALVDALVAYSMRQEYRIRPLTRDHPLYKIF